VKRGLPLPIDIVGSQQPIRAIDIGPHPGAGLAPSRTTQIRQDAD
jgi:hypothetical protein